MRLIDNNQIVIGNGHRLRVIAHQMLYHALHSRHFDSCFGVKPLLSKITNVVDVVKGGQLLQLDVLEYILSLFPEGVAIHQEQDAMEAIRGQEAVDHTENRPGLTGARSHGEQNTLLPANDSLLSGLYGSDLIVTEIKTIRIAEEIIRRVFELGIRFRRIVLQQRGKPFRTHPALESAGSIGRVSNISEPDARFLFPLLHVLPAIGSEQKRHLVFTPAAHTHGQIFRTY